MSLVNEIDYATDPAGKAGHDWQSTGNATVASWNAAGYYESRNYGNSIVTPFDATVSTTASPEAEVDVEIVANETNTKEAGITLFSPNNGETTLHFRHNATSWLLDFRGADGSGKLTVYVNEGASVFGGTVPPWTPRGSIKLALTVKTIEELYVITATGYVNSQKVLETEIRTLEIRNPPVWRPAMYQYYSEVHVRSFRFNDSPATKEYAPPRPTSDVVHRPVISVVPYLDRKYASIKQQNFPQGALTVLVQPPYTVPEEFTLTSERDGLVIHGFIHGTLKVKNKPVNIPVSRRVYLLCELSMKVVSAALSKADGTFIFHRVAVGNRRRYTVLAYDPLTGFNAVVESGREPTPYRQIY